MRTMSEEHLMKDVLKVLGRSGSGCEAITGKLPMKELERSKSTFYF